MAARLYDNAKVLVAAYRVIAKSTRIDRPITPAAEWLLDNFHVVEEQIREIKIDLPPDYYRQLPKLATGHLKDYPRVFGLAWAFVAHTDSRFDLNALVRFVNAYQRVQPLTIGELWAIAITLRVTLVENLRRLAEAVMRDRAASQEADAVADRLLGIGGEDPEPAASVLRDFGETPLPAAFAAQLDHRLRDQDATVAPALRWLDERLTAQGTTLDQILQDELRLQGAHNVTVRNVITSMRAISNIDWAGFFESVSLVDAVLRADSEFEAMEFVTRDMYRRAIERLSRGSGQTELEVANRVVAVAKQAVQRAPEGKLSDRERDPGYYLIARGRRQFERQLGYRPRAAEFLSRVSTSARSVSYLGLIVLTTIFVAALPVYALGQTGIADWTLVWFGFLAIVPASDIAVTLVNRAVVKRFGPAILPGMELAEGVPAHLRTIVVMPVLLTGRAHVQDLIERLEVHYLASGDGDLYFALLSDWADADSEITADDDALLETANEGIAHLNRRYGPGVAGSRFMVLHRRRVWNASEGKWIGWERKRGKLHELNRLLRGATDTTFMEMAGKKPSVPSDVRYVITLDADTRLPREAAKRLIGKMAHPLNRPRLDREARLVVEGHAILQPRVTPSLPIGREGSLFQRVFSAPRGLDPYAFAVSDVYQDLFEEGSYTGKGIYDIDAFETSLDGRIPENTVLSHDLLEGCFARAGLVSDIEVVEEFPSRYDVAATRQHRWVRGDWQLLPWIFGYGRIVRGRKRNCIQLIGRWKMVDNLRRSLSAPAALLALLCGWTLAERAAGLWTGFILASIVLPSLLPWLASLMPRRDGISKRGYLLGLGNDLEVSAIQIAFLITFLAHQAWMMLDAVLRTIFRLFIRRRRLLEWTTAADVSYNMKSDWRRVLSHGALAAAFAIATFWLLHIAAHGTQFIAAPLLALWTLSPAIARWASHSAPTTGHLAVSESDALALRLTARRTWRFFENFVTAEDNMLPPDNFQEEPRPVVAHRTSPTNIGLYLLSIVAAHDFGWIGTLDAIERLEGAFDALKKLEQFKGHFYNWYATDDLRPLHPRYVSTVDSGNLAGHLIVLAHACREMAAEPLRGNERLAGVGDAIDLADESLGSLGTVLSKRTANVKRLKEALEAMRGALRWNSAGSTTFDERLAELLGATDAATVIARTLSGETNAATSGDLLVWMNAIHAGIRSHMRDIDYIGARLRATSSDDRRKSFTLATAHSTIDDAFATDSAGSNLTSNRDGVVRTLIHQAPERRLSGRVDPDIVLGTGVGIAMEASLGERLDAIALSARTMFEAMNFDFLYESERQLFAIGYRVDDGALDANCYDLLASEARLASFIAIAKEDVPAKHWFRLGRTLAPVEHGSALISWSGSMFEYLMPSLVMRAPAGSILEHTNRLIVRRQITYGRSRSVPWGISESQFNARDMEGTYQYSSFGVPDLGYKRGLGENIVIAPYATALAAMVDPAAAVANFKHLCDEGGCSTYGLYEALDYTPERIPAGAKVGVVRAYMAHHQAMSIIAIGNALRAGAMRTRFHAEPIVQATELLLQERMPRDVAVARPPARTLEATVNTETPAPEIQRRHRSPHSRIPRTHLLSNGSYAVMLTGAGSGYSRWHNLDVTRWHEDVTCDNWGSYIFLRDTRSGEVWSAGYQPTGIEPDSYESVFSEGRAEFTRQDGTIRTTMEVVVSPEHNAEVRRVSITNTGGRTREIELTSYAEIVLAPHADDAAHPAFLKLFVETEFVPGAGTLLATRRRRAPDEPELWAAHLVVVEGESSASIQFETDRARFLGRGQRIRTPISVTEGWPLSNTAGCVLDPIFSLRCRVRIPRGESVRVSFWTLVAESRDEALDLADKHREPNVFERVHTLTWTQAQGQFHHLGIGPEEAHMFQRLANRILFSDRTLRPPAEILKRGGRNLSALWAYGISGDLPIVLLRIDALDELGIVRQLLHAYEYWRLKRLAVDLVILNDRATSYIQDLQGAIEQLVRPIQSRPRGGRDDVRGNIFVLRTDLVPPEIRELLQTVVRVVLFSRRGTLSEQINRIEETKLPVIVLPPWSTPPAAATEMTRTRLALEFFNGLGGFAYGGREYVTILEPGQSTPAPWINVIANSEFGFQVSTDGAGFTWALNSQQHRLTPWSNDPVSDPPGEAIYLRDDDSGEVWTPTALPIREETGAYTIRHGQGYSRFEHDSHGIALELLQFVPVDDPVKISRVKITNLSKRVRNLSLTAYVEWVLGTSRPGCASYIVTEIDPETGAMFALNPLSNEFGTRVAFADLDGRQNSWTGDRTEFLGRNGMPVKPMALMRGTPLSNKTGAGLDPCGALQTTLRLKAGGMLEVVFIMGEAASATEAQSLITKYRTTDLNAVLGAVTKFWDEMLGKVQVKTPDRAMDILVNRWLPYQTLSCRVWARSGFYQSSGAYGFRDQLQDAASLAVTKPDIAREHLVRAASRQFLEGDVQHWWVPESGRGIRTRVSDDRVWLPNVAAHYVEATGDTGLLDEMVPFIEGPVLQEGEHDAFFQPTILEKPSSFFEHCALALDGALAVGAHGLPLMGTGDWNDGMNLVGEDGKGESVWLGWFLHATLIAFARIADDRDVTRAARWREHAASLREALEKSWDGDWYRRAYFGDGTPLGSVTNVECRIDSIAQSWSVMSGAGEPARAQRAMAAVEKYLVRRDDGLILLFTPPFDKAVPNPGYIKGYPPGIRENGGQYTHAALWASLAFAGLGDGDMAYELLSLLNPIHHASNNAAIHRYKVEPYVVSADVYGVPPHVGRGGWTWYTGSAGWMHRAVLEGLLGLNVRGATLVLDPCIPKAWPGFDIIYRHGSATYQITVENPNRISRGIGRIELDGQATNGPQGSFPLADDGGTHRVRVVLGRSEERQVPNATAAE